MTFFGPHRPHWLSQAAQPFKRRQNRREQQKSSFPPVAPLYANAAYYFNGRASATESPSSLRLDIISHVFYAFASLREDGVVELGNVEVDVNLPIDGTHGCLQAFSQQKRRHSHLKLILSIGGATGGANFAAVAADPEKRETCAATARSTIDQYGFDGIDIDWEFPDAGQQSVNFIALLATLRSRLPRPRYLLTTALPAGEWVLSRIDLPAAASHLDYLNLMGYDFCGDWEPRISGHQAQLYSSSGRGNSDSAVRYVKSVGFPPEKILLGCPAYGWSFLGCSDIDEHFIECGGNGGTFDFKDLPRPGTEECVDEVAVAAYCVSDEGGFVSFDNPQTVQIKANYAKDSGLGGLFYWHATADSQGPRSLVLAGYTELHS